MKDLIKGALITLVIGGSAYTFSTGAVVENFAEDTGLSQEQAEQYVNEVDEADLVSFDTLGSDMVSEGEELSDFVSEIDCINYEYDWESTALPCKKGKEQISILANSYIALGRAYIILDSEYASNDDIRNTLPLIDQLNANYQLNVVAAVLDWKTIDETRKTNFFNKAMLKAALEGE
jgi:hypothetical protein